jgi:hypothetical protein
MIETVWVSFADREKFRGVAIVDVDLKPRMTRLKQIIAVVQRTIEMGCNAGPDTSVQMLRARRFIDLPDYKNKLIFDEVPLKEMIGEEWRKQRLH